MKKTITLLIITFLVSCQSQSDTAETAADNKETIRNSQPQASPGKPSAPIKMDYQLLGKPVIGQPLEISVNLSTPINKTVNAKYSHEKQLHSDNHRQLSFKPASGRKPENRIISITPMEEGIHYITIMAEVEIDDRIQAKSFVIPIEVGEVDWKKHLAPEGTIKNDSNGGKVISLPAE